MARAYEAVLDQDRFDELISLAETSITDPAAHEHLIRRRREFDSHFETAEKLLANLSTPETVDDRPFLKLASDLTILSANTLAETTFGVSEGAHLEDLELDTDSLSQIRKAISSRSEDWPVVRVPSLVTGKQVLLALSCRQGRSGALEWSLTGVDRVWQPGASLAMQSLYGLTQSETDVLSSLVSGLAPTEIAEKRNRSVETVRQQIKSMIGKTRSSGSNELVSLARAVGESAGRRRIPGAVAAGAERLEVRLRDGRRLDYLEQGAQNGKPVVFLHGCLCGNKMPNPAARFFSENGIRLLSPARPWHGQSDGSNALLHDPRRYAQDLKDWLDQLGVKRFTLVAFDVGAIFALVCGPELSDRVTRLICVSAQPPMRGFQDFAGAPPQQKLFAILPRVSVSLLSYMAKLGDKRLKRDGPSGFAQTVFGGAAADLEACKDPHLLDLFWQGHLFHVERGSDSFINDCRFVASDWERLLTPHAVPVQFVHGTQNRSVPPERVLSFASRVDAQVTLVENAGHSLPFSHWKDWVRFLDLEQT